MRWPGAIVEQFSALRCRALIRSCSATHSITAYVAHAQFSPASGAWRTCALSSAAAFASCAIGPNCPRNNSPSVRACIGPTSVRSSADDADLASMSSGDWPWVCGSHRLNSLPRSRGDTDRTAGRVSLSGCLADRQKGSGVSTDSEQQKSVASDLPAVFVAVARGGTECGTTECAASR